MALSNAQAPNAQDYAGGMCTGSLQYTRTLTDRAQMKSMP